MAEWLGRALQKLLQRFESARDLQKITPLYWRGFYFTMKHSQLIGIAACICLITVCFCPWIEVASLQQTFNGINGYVNKDVSFGKQVLSHSFFCVLLCIFFLIPKVLAKRINIFIALVNMGWAFKNYILFSMCRQGECPIVKPALYLLVVFAIIIQVMTFLPKSELPKED